VFLNKRLSGLVPYAPGEQPKATAGLIKLNTNESPFPPSPAAIAAVTRAELDDLRLYSDPACDKLVSAIAQYHGVSRDMVFPGNGSDEVLALIFHGMCGAGALFPDITYGFYRVFARMFGVGYEEIPLKSDFSVDIQDYAGKTGTVFLANPNAPTGLFLPLDKIRALLEQNKNRLIVVDEAYVEFGGESVTELLTDYVNLIAVRTFSKSRSLAGARIGYAVANPAVIAELNTLKFSFNPYNVNRLSILMGAAALRDDDYFEGCRREIIRNRETLTAGLKELGFTIPESKANFILAGDNPGVSGGDFFAGLRKKGILVRYFNTPRIDNYVRITIGTSEQTDALLRAAKELLK
jgi:histidinol-phosphate aminotransferase